MLQWAREGQRDVLAAVEDELTPLARRHGAVVRRDRAAPLDGYGDPDRPPPDEVHAVDFPDREQFAAFLSDPEREPLRERLAAALERTEVWVLEPMDDATRDLARLTGPV